MQAIVPLVRAVSPNPGYFEFTLEAPWIAETAVPGQFVHVRLPSGYHPLLRRPFSVYFTDGKEQASFLFRVEGEGTHLLSLCKEGDELDVLGPRGRGFRIDDIQRGEPVILVGGGVGIPPIHFLSVVLRDRGIEHDVFLGVRGKEHIIATERLEAVGQQVMLCTDDGSEGREGLVTEAVEERLQKLGDTPVRLYACGPTPMLEVVINFCHWYGNVSAQISLEERMSCAIGACMGCVVKTVRGYERVCTEGPVFDARDIKPGTWLGP
jgi:dihydroorotate dehydrogenase electron transfer subunit